MQSIQQESGSFLPSRECATVVYGRSSASESPFGPGPITIHARLVAAHVATAPPPAVPVDGVLVETMATTQALQAN